ncbi:GNAT family N-acetyltransferase [Rhodovibrio salinarum]|uniref:GNAT family N-acetyltransferase n=1 Tax=Rhodovibrio salinarum TaxID=1087 RepID=A0A934QK81_9PROT|nr:GNAT family N-acetyltransferase [Rhodovibrio salinarum]MBK1698237.1 GNAT family N-acetyltransferase [Rhodovibrio salinarum]
MSVARVSRTEWDFDALLTAHLACIRGVYCDGIDELSGGGRYLWSRYIPDPVFNYAVDTDPTVPGELRHIATRRQRPAAVMARQAPPPGNDYALEVEAAWMVRDLHANGPPSPIDSEVRISAGDPPPEAFLDGFSQTESEVAVNRHIERHYVHALRCGIAERADASWHFMVLRDGAAIAFGSLYRTGELAGLYNVATRVDARRQGLASTITRAALRVAHEAGASAAFLQCGAGSAAEALYRSHGFQTVCRPWLLELPASS